MNAKLFLGLLLAFLAGLLIGLAPLATNSSWVVVTAPGQMTIDRVETPIIPIIILICLSATVLICLAIMVLFAWSEERERQVQAVHKDELPERPSMPRPSLLQYGSELEARLKDREHDRA